MIALILRKRVERQVTAATDYLVNLPVGIGRREGVRLGPKLLQRQTGLAQAAGRGRTDILTEYRKGLPQGKGLEGQDNLYVGLPRHIGYECQVAAQFLLFDDIDRCCERHTLHSFVVD